MASLIKDFKKWFIIWIWLMISIIFNWLLIVYAANIFPSKVEDWDTLNKDIINNIIDYSVPKGAIIPFNSSVCPNWWIAADWTNWTIDLRWEFIRGWDNWRGVDSGRGLATSQWDAIRNITWTLNWVSWQSNQAYNWWFAPWQNWAFNVNGSLSSYNKYWWAYSVSSWRSAQFDASLVVPTADENRPRNISLLYCIKL